MSEAGCRSKRLPACLFKTEDTKARSYIDGAGREINEMGKGSGT